MARELHKFPHEVERMSSRDLIELSIFYRLEAEEREKTRHLASAKTGAQARRVAAAKRV